MKVNLIQNQNFSNNRINFKSRQILSSKRQFSTLAKLNNDFFTKQVSNKCKKITDKIISLPDYGKFLLPFIVDKKKSELEYLYGFAKQTDKYGEMRIPAAAFPLFSQISEEHLKALEPIILSKNNDGRWNYAPSFILDLSEKYDAIQIEKMTKMAQLKVNGFNVKKLIENPMLNHSEIIEKAELLKDLYGNRLREVEFLSNSDKENFFRADVVKEEFVEKDEMLPKSSRTVEALMNKSAGKMSEEFLSNYEKIIEDTLFNIKKNLKIFSVQDLEIAINKVKKAVPDATNAEILRTMQKLTQFASYSSLSKIADKLDKENIVRIFYKGGLNDVFSYFSRNKYILNLPFDKPIKLGGMFVTKDDIADKEFIEILKDKSQFSDERFMILEGWSDGINLFNDNYDIAEKTINVLKQARKIEKQKNDFTFNDALKYVLNHDIEKKMKKLGCNYFIVSNDTPALRQNILDQMKPISLSDSMLQSTIKAIANYFVKNNTELSNLSQKIAEYYRDNLNVYSKQRMINDLKILKEKINNFVSEKGISKDKIYILTPKPTNEPAKSYSIVNKMLSEVMDIPKERQISVYDLKELPRLPEDAVLVIADDVIASGYSMSFVAGYSSLAGKVLKDKSVLFCPITGAREGINYLEDVIAFLNRKGKDAVIYIDDNIKSYEHVADCFTKNDKNEIYTKVFGDEGCSELGMCTTFPYMAPDNNSGLSSFLVKHFTPTDDCIKSKNFLLPKISEEALYLDIFGEGKNDVEKKSRVKKILANIVNRLLCYL